MKNIAMIPMALGSTRIKDKNLLFVDGWPLAYYVVRACQESGVFDEIYLNSEHEIFRKYAKDLGCEFYQRPSYAGGSSCIMKNNSSQCDNIRCQVHDHYLMDFMNHFSSDYLIQIHTTSPLLKSETIRGFVETLNSEYDSLFSVVDYHEETFYDGKPVNFDLNIKTPTQNLKPVQPLSWAMAGWNTLAFKEVYEDGPTFCGKVGRYPISKIEAIDVDNYEDLYLAEACLNHRKRESNVGKHYYNEDVLYIEDDLIDLIKKDGSPCPDVLSYNQPLTKLDEVIDQMGNGSWCYPLVYSTNDQVAFIQQVPEEGCRKHYHTTKDEYWYIVKGKFTWTVGMDEKKVILAEEGDVVFLPKGTIHYITCVDDKPSIRMANGERDMNHVYV